MPTPAMLVFMSKRFARDAAGALIRTARRHPMLSREEGHVLARRAARGDREATQRLVASHLRLAIKIAERYRAPGLARGDLIQEGCIGQTQDTGESRCRIGSGRMRGLSGRFAEALTYVREPQPTVNAFAAEMKTCAHS